MIIALICFAVANAMLAQDNARHAHQPAVLVVLLAFATCAPLALRTRFPLSAWAASALALIVTSQVITAGIVPAVPVACSSTACACTR